MKIAIDARLYGTEFTGLGRYVLNLVENLTKIDHKNEYYILLRSNYYKKLKLPNNFNKVKADIPIYTIREQIALPVILREIKPDLVHFPHLNVPVFYKGNFIVTLHDIIMHRQGKEATTLPIPLYYAKRIPYRIVSSFAVNFSKKIIVPSNAVKDEVVKYFKLKDAKVMVTYEGVDKKIYTSKKGKHSDLGKYFLYVGNSYPHKNLKRLVKAIKYLNEELKSKSKLVVRTTDNLFKDKLVRYIEEHKALEYIDFLPYVKDEELAQLYKGSVAFIFPSMSEGFGLPGLEAIQNKTLVLTSDIPVFKEVYQDKVIYFDLEDYKDIAQKMKKTSVMSDVKRQKVVKESQKLLKQYSWKKMAEETLKIYNTVNEDIK